MKFAVIHIRGVNSNFKAKQDIDQRLPFHSHIYFKVQSKLKIVFLDNLRGKPKVYQLFAEMFREIDV